MAQSCRVVAAHLQCLRAAPCAWARSKSGGTRAYLAIAGGIDVPRFLGSRGTFMLGGFGGHAGRALRAGDVVHLLSGSWTQRARASSGCNDAADLCATVGDRRALRAARRARVLHAGRHRDAVRARNGACTTSPTAPACGWSDPSPSGRARMAAKRACIPRTSTTTHMPSAPSTSPATCPSCWAPMGRAWADSFAQPWSSRPNAGSWASSKPATRCASAASRSRRPKRWRQQWSVLIATLQCARCRNLPATQARRAGDSARPSNSAQPATVYRADGDKYLLVEYGRDVLDLGLRFRVHLLEGKLRAAALSGHHRHHSRRAQPADSL